MSVVVLLAKMLSISVIVKFSENTIVKIAKLYMKTKEYELGRIKIKDFIY